MTEMRLTQLLREIEDLRLVGQGDPEIRRIVYDSRQPCQDALFAALPGEHSQGADYALDALKGGAVALLVQKPFPEVQVPQIVSPAPRATLSRISAAFYKHPSRALRLTGITGTNGKTTVAYGLRHVLKTSGNRVGLLGTIEYDTGTAVRAAPLTTPESVDFSQYLCEMVEAGAEDAVVEVSSHALSQNRVAGHQFACAVFTNLSRDHLDYHKTMEQYCDAKKRLFHSLAPGGGAVLNADDCWHTRLMEGLTCPVSLYGSSDACHLRVRRQSHTLAGTVADLEMGGVKVTLRTPLVGAFNLENCLAILAAAERLHVPLPEAVESLSTFTGTPGRLERFVAEDDVTAFVDYAHTDDALRSVAGALKPLTKGRLWVVFGCGGDRDRGKRPLMAKAAEDWGDRVILTSDNPRTEDPAQIFSDIRKGFSKDDIISCIPDRPDAIHRAIVSAAPGDVVLVAGKGHENYQIVGTRKFPMDDRELVQTALQDRRRSKLQCK